MSKIVGIDLGTTNSAVAVVEGGEPVIIPLSDGSRLCPSVVGFSAGGERLVGTLAKRQAITNPDRTVASIKRHMGSAYTVKIGEKTYTPQQISSHVLMKLRTDAEAYLGQPVKKAVITVPAYFSDAQRQATKDAGTIAGLDVVRIINEPTAAALAYGLDKLDAHNVLVWDLGGGTFDVSILELGEGVFEVKATSGDNRLGGDDWDQAIINWMVEEFRELNGIDLSADRIAMQRLKEAAEKAKMELSSVVTTAINLPFISVKPEGPVHLEMTLTRAAFEQMTTQLLERMKAPTQQALADSGISVEELDVVLLVGGSTRMPAVQELAKRMFHQEPHRGINPDEVVALGAAIQGGILAGEVKDIVLLDVTPLSLGIETLGGVFTRLIERNTTIPTFKTQMFTTAVDNQSTVDIHVLQGERQMAADNKSLGRFSLTGIKPAPRGIPKIEVTFDIDVNGIAHVSAKDTATGLKQSIVIKSTTSLSKEEVSKLMKEAEATRAADEAWLELQELRNRADGLIYNAENAISTAEGSCDEHLILPVRTGISKLKEACQEKDRAVIRSEMDSLTQEMIRLGEALHEETIRKKGPQESDAEIPEEINQDEEVRP